MKLLPWSKLRRARLAFANDRDHNLQNDSAFVEAVCGNADHRLGGCLVLLRWCVARECGIHPDKIHASDSTDCLAVLVGSDTFVGYWFAAREIDSEFYNAVSVEMNAVSPQSVSWDWETVALTHRFCKDGEKILLRNWILPVAEDLYNACKDQSAIMRTVEQFQAHISSWLI